MIETKQINKVQIALRVVHLEQLVEHLFDIVMPNMPPNTQIEANDCWNAYVEAANEVIDKYPGSKEET